MPNPLLDLPMATSSTDLLDWNLELRPSRQGRLAAAELVIQSSEPVLLEKVRTLLELFHDRLPKADQAQMDTLVEVMLKTLAPAPDNAMLYQASANASARAELLNHYELLTSAQIHERYGARARNTAALAARWRRQRRILAVDWAGQLLFPAFQFDNQGRPLPVMERLLAILTPANSEWAIAIWLITPNGWLGGRRPVELLTAEPDSVCEAANDEVTGAVY